MVLSLWCSHCNTVTIRTTIVINYYYFVSQNLILILQSLGGLEAMST